MVGMIRKKWFLGALSSSVIIFSFILLMQAQSAAPQKAKASQARSSANVVVVTESTSGKLISVAKVKLETSGYVVIHDGKGGTPGAVLGYSKLLEKGEVMDVVVGLSKSVADGEVLYAMLHLDNGDGKFDAKADMPAEDGLGAPVMQKVVVGTAVEGASQITY